MGPWRGSMAAALAATLGRPAWWSMALAAFLIRGGILVLLLPIVPLPQPAAFAAVLSPTISQLAFGGLTVDVLLASLGILIVAAALLGAVGLAGAWLDRVQLSEAATDEDLDLGWAPTRIALREALALRLAAHLPTLVASAYATFRLIAAAYDELLSPGDAAIPLLLRVVARAPDAVLLLAATWLGGEAVGALAARRAASGASFRGALAAGARQAFGRRGLATLSVTTLAIAGVLGPFLLVAGRAWEHLRDVLLANAHPALVGTALLVLVTTWILGLACTGAALAWRSAAWTAEVTPARRAPAEAAPVTAEA